MIVADLNNLHLRLLTIPPYPRHRLSGLQSRMSACPLGFWGLCGGRGQNGGFNLVISSFHNPTPPHPVLSQRRPACPNVRSLDPRLQASPYPQVKKMCFVEHKSASNSTLRASQRLRTCQNTDLVETRRSRQVPGSEPPSKSVHKRWKKIVAKKIVV